MSQSHIKIAICDLNGILRSKYIAKTKYEKALKEGLGFCDVIFGSDIDDQLIDNLHFTGWHSGYPDVKLQIVEDSKRQLAYEDGRDFVLCELANDNASHCPRGILRSVIKRASQMGFDAYAGMEYEFTLFDETPDSLHDKQFSNLKPVTPGNFGYSLLRTSQLSEFYDLLLQTCEQMNLPLESLHTEIGPGVLEAALAKAPILEAADRAIIFKSVVKALAQQFGWTACFMAKWSPENQGQSGHIHLSLGDQSEQNVFYDEAQPHHISQTLRYFIGGQQHLMPEFLSLNAPFINSYARLVPGYWAPVQATWGVDNRTCALRVIQGSAHAQRIEYRIAGADSNPYLAMSAALSSGLWGIENQVKPTAPIAGNAYELTHDGHLALPTNLCKSAENFRYSEHAQIFFDKKFIEDYATIKDWEILQYQKAVTDWQLARYFELA